ncbi:Scd6-like Sm domain-containing protein [Crepidotus variabilis]|uniref:Scd6-like Sm domain-containing protein n=1 Tax=Crepidotus variabilis TaxID=179855 RepID=A0A9P6JUT4_9AGAR|nr:Scd6-like Sm domain-containing protein [Crepidotus variabilis]
MALSFIGKPISLISHSDIRYRGTLAGIDPQASTIQLENVFSMGTESRRPPNQFIAPVSEPYAYIVFRASEVKDLAVDDQNPAPPPPPSRSVHDDPAVLGASAPIVQPTYAFGAPQPVQAFPVPQMPGGPAGVVPMAPEQTQPRGPPHPQVNLNRNRPNPLHTANASLETVERAMSDLRVNGPSSAPHHNGHTGGRGGRRGRGGRGGGPEHIPVPKTDFDFESSNAKFDKTAAAKSTKSPVTEEVPSTTEDGGDTPAENGPKAAYNPKSSFFDSLSSSAAIPSDRGGHGGDRGGRGRRGGGPGGRTRRDEEREKNVATFGEPGGVGLLGPGAYVGGWGGYGRRGGKPRRGGSGGPRGGAQAAAARG